MKLFAACFVLWTLVVMCILVVGLAFMGTLEGIIRLFA